MEFLSCKSWTLKVTKQYLSDGAYMVGAAVKTNSTSIAQFSLMSLFSIAKVIDHAGQNVFRGW
jgi:hypothetical protein